VSPDGDAPTTGATAEAGVASGTDGGGSAWAAVATHAAAVRRFRATQEGKREGKRG
jgi:hypothetical protein